MFVIEEDSFNKWKVHSILKDTRAKLFPNNSATNKRFSAVDFYK